MRLRWQQLLRWVRPQQWQLQHLHAVLPAAVHVLFLLLVTAAPSRHQQLCRRLLWLLQLPPQQQRRQQPWPLVPSATRTSCCSNSWKSSSTWAGLLTRSWQLLLPLQQLHTTPALTVSQQQVQATLRHHQQQLAHLTWFAPCLAHGCSRQHHTAAVQQEHRQLREVLLTAVVAVLRRRRRSSGTLGLQTTTLFYSSSRIRCRGLHCR